MPRKRPDDRLDQLVESAASVFTALGYRRAQMADVAKAMGVAPGTLYLYVESKEALFDLVVQRAYAKRPPHPLPNLPVPTPPPGTTLKRMKERIAKGRKIPALEDALKGRRVRDPEVELEAIVRGLYDNLYHNRRVIKLMDRSALDYPELASVWYGEGRANLLGRLTRYLTDRIRRKFLRPVPDVAVAARFILETTVLFAIHIHWDPAPQTMDEETVRRTLVQFIVNGLRKD